ncbi:hypothetical protein EDD21DRAFT_17012, partial [Dissophora ornata]
QPHQRTTLIFSLSLPPSPSSHSLSLPSAPSDCPAQLIIVQQRSLRRQDQVNIRSAFEEPKTKRKSRSNQVNVQEIDMLSSPFSPWRSILSPQDALEAANAHLENARKAKSSELALTFCNEAQTALARIRTSVRKTLVSSVSVEDRAIRNEIASTYFELGELLGNLKHRDKAQTCYKNSEKWG